MPDWGATVAKVEKIMGDKAKVPPIPGTVKKASDQFDKTWKEFEKARDAAGEKLLAWQNAVSGWENASQQFADKLSGSDLGCDKGASDYKKNRAEAQKVLDQFFKEVDKVAQANIKNGQELDKHMNNLSGYKSPETPEL